MPSNKQMFISIIHVFRDYPNHLALIKRQFVIKLQMDLILIQNI